MLSGIARVRRKITTYAILTPERRRQIVEEIQARRATCIAVGLSPDSREPKEEVEEQSEEDEKEQLPEPMEVADLEEDEAE